MARKNRLRRHSKKHTGRNILLTLLLLIIIGITAGAFILFETEKPTVNIDKQISFLGSSVRIPLMVEDHKSGIGSVVLEIEQNGKKKQFFNRTFQRKAWFSAAGPHQLKETVEIDVRKTGVKDGKAILTVSARDFSLNGLLKGNETTLSVPVTVDTKPPRVAVEHSQQYIRPGGSGIVIYTISEPAVRHGVEIDNLFFPGFALSNGKRFIAYIALPWDSGKPEQTQVIAVDEAGNIGKSIFSMNLKKVPDKRDRINVTDGFLKKKIPEFEEHYPELTGTMLEQYIFTNNEIRRRNAETIKEACSKPVPEMLWHDRFVRMPGAGRAGFADQRTYFYKGKAIDHQTHLGMDIASTARVAIKAANSGKVIFGEYLGIYGNTVILDHGQGVFSLYSHLSRIDTTLGALVAKNELIGHSGATGMAGGDHLHFSILIHGIFVTPKEWWDQHWIDVNINNIIGK
ncbi:MAG TPA: M23 family metallopeptidase [Desulfobulbaceae bacterium]|nr:M23 family metallopeptidase [Desulfobulbaceae bacterium]